MNAVERRSKVGRPAVITVGMRSQCGRGGRSAVVPSWELLGPLLSLFDGHLERMGVYEYKSVCHRSLMAAMQGGICRFLSLHE